MNKDYDPTDLRGQEEAKREAEDAARLARETEIGDLKWLMSSKRGRRIVRRLLSMAGTFRLSFDRNAMQMAFNEGNRNLGNRLLDEVMEFCPEMFPVMEREQQEDRARGEAAK